MTPTGTRVSHRGFTVTHLSLQTSNEASALANDEVEALQKDFKWGREGFKWRHEVYILVDIAFSCFDGAKQMPVQVNSGLPSMDDEHTNF